MSRSDEIKIPQETAKYPGEWVIVEDNKILAHAKDATQLKPLIDEGRGLLLFVPTGEILLY